MTKAYLSSIILQGAELGRENPLPSLRDIPFSKKLTDGGLLPSELEGFGYMTGRRALPYAIKDGYAREKSDMTIKTAVLENDAFCATFLPEYGGRLYSLFDKLKKRDLLYVNPVFQPANLAVRNAWFSGGIEWNCGQYGHSSFTCDDVFFAMCENDGVPFLRMYEYERIKGWYVQIDFHLPEGEGLAAHVRLINSKNEPNSLYYWTNAAIPLERRARVMSATKEVILTAPNGGTFDLYSHEQMPELSVLPGVDGSYPAVFPFSCEYFFQNAKEEKSAWEGVAYDDGFAFFERSTAQMPYRKMFAWANSAGGTHWQEFLSVKGGTHYFEAQSGLYPTQVHGGDVEAKAVIEFTQVFGGLDTEAEKTHDCEWQDSCDYMYEKIEECYPAQRLIQLDEQCRKLATCQPGELLHCGSGWGALEEEREPGITPDGLTFPKKTLGECQVPWLSLLKGGAFGEHFTDAQPAFVTDKRWKNVYERAMAAEQNAELIFQYALMLYENGDFDGAKGALTKSLHLNPQSRAYVALSTLYMQTGDGDKAVDMAKQAFAHSSCEERVYCAVVVIDTLERTKRHKDAWEFYGILSDELKQSESVRLRVCPSAYEVGEYGFLSEQFETEFAKIRECDADLSRLWYSVQAQKLIASEGDFEKALAKAKSTLTLPQILDFRVFE